MLSFGKKMGRQHFVVFFSKMIAILMGGQCGDVLSYVASSPIASGSSGYVSQISDIGGELAPMVVKAMVLLLILQKISYGVLVR